MIGTRYEEYSHFEGDIPFVLLPELCISRVTHHNIANWHDNIELQLCRSGRGTVMIDEKFIPFEKNDIVVINSNVLHHTDSDETVKLSCLIIDTAFCRNVGLDPATLRFSEKIKSDSFTELFDRLIELYGKKEDDCRIAKMNTVILKMLIELREKHTVAVNSADIKNKYFGMVKDTIKFIRENYEKKLSLDFIAKNILTNKYTLSREFRKATGQTVIQYLVLYRCKRASDLISDGMSVSEAAVACGFDNMSFFTRTFKQYMGCLPSKYKKD